VFKATDAVTGQVLGAGVDRRVGGGSIQTAAQWQWGDAENVIKTWSQLPASTDSALELTLEHAVADPYALQVGVGLVDPRYGAGDNLFLCRLPPVRWQGPAGRGGTFLGRASTVTYQSFEGRL
jgi:hypothetical protein